IRFTSLSAGRLYLLSGCSSASNSDREHQYFIIKDSFRKFWDCGYSPHRKELLLLTLVVDINCVVCGVLLSGAEYQKQQSLRKGYFKKSLHACFSVKGLFPY